MQNAKLKTVRDRFFEGETPGLQSATATRAIAQREKRERRLQESPKSAQQMLNRLAPRVRRIVIRAVNNSVPATSVVTKFENFVLASFLVESRRHTRIPKTHGESQQDWWKDLLLELPVVNIRKDGNRQASFFFDGESTTGGFHRLLLHACCQFYGLQVSSKELDMAVTSKETPQQAMALTVTGSILTDAGFRLVEAVTKDE